MDLSRIEGVITTVVSLSAVLGAALRLYLQPMISKALEKQTADFQKMFTDHLRYDHGYRAGRQSNKNRYEHPSFAPETSPEEQA